MALEVDTRTDGGIAVVTVRGELDMAGSVVLEDELRRLEDEPGLEHIVVDLSQLDFMDSSGLRTLVLADRRIGEDGRRFALVPGGEPVQRVFEITRMHERLTWADAPAQPLRDHEERA